MEEQNTGTATAEGMEATESTHTAPDDATGVEESPQPESGANKERTFTKSEVEAQIKERLERDRKKQSQKAQEQAAEARAEWEELAKTRAQRIEELEPTVERVEALEGIVLKHVEAERKGLDKPILQLLDQLSVEGQFEWLTENRASLVVSEPEPSSGRRAPDAGRRSPSKTPYDREKDQFNNMLRVRGLRQ